MTLHARYVRQVFRGELKTLQGEFEPLPLAEREASALHLLMALSHARGAEKLKAPAPAKCVSWLRRQLTEEGGAHLKKHRKPLDLPLAKGVKTRLLWIPPGSFRMGWPKRSEIDPAESVRAPAENKELRSFEATLTKGFWMGRTLFTCGEYQAMGWVLPDGVRKPQPSWPVQNVRWVQLVADTTEPMAEPAPGSLLAQLSERAGRTISLPTEVQWEFAARAGTTSTFLCGSLRECLGGYDAGGPLPKLPWLPLPGTKAKVQKAPDRPSPSSREPVREVQKDWEWSLRLEGYILDYYGVYWRGKSPCHRAVDEYWPNAWGLYGMIGSLCQWCLDKKGDYPDFPASDWRQTKGQGRVHRGGVELNPHETSASAFRSWGVPNPKGIAYGIGFRIVAPDA